MRYLAATATIGVLALSAIQCEGGQEATGGAGTNGQAGTGDQAGIGGTSSGPATGGNEGNVVGTAGTGGTGGVAGTGQTGGTAGSAGSPAGVAGTTGTAGAAGMAGTTGAGGTGGIRRGPFRILVLSTALNYQHDSISTGLTMLIDLGKATAPERATVSGLATDSTWTVDVIATPHHTAPSYLAEVTAENLRNYELFYSNNPTGPVFTSAPNAAEKKQVFIDYWMNGGSWAGHHAATDFEKDDNGASWTWWHDNIDGSSLKEQDVNGTPGVVVWQPNHVDHPILRGLTSPWDCREEWYLMQREEIEAVGSGFQVLAKVTVSTSTKNTSPRPAIWIRQNPNGRGARAFYTIRGHNRTTFAEPQFRELILRGILGRTPPARQRLVLDQV